MHGRRSLDGLRNPRLDGGACYRALRTRDARFDGRFYTAVRTTGVFCRPICPARTPRPENCEFYPSAAAASEAGYRPCLRCRPEAAPGTPAWLGTSATVQRALRLIDQGALDAAGAPDLAERLGVTDRHLRRLFERHLGASPRAVAGMRRVLFAKQLLDETALPMTQVAVAAGFGSLRRFNDALRSTYGRTPTELRRRRGSAPGGDGVRLSLPVRAPYDAGALLGYLSRRAIPGVEAVADGGYWRSLRADGRAAALCVTPEGGALRLEVIGAPTAALGRIVGSVRRLFDLDADPAVIAAALAEDARLAPLVAKRPGLRVPGALDPFELGVRAILGQQVSVAAATTTSGRLAAQLGTPLPTSLRRQVPEAIRLLFPEPAALLAAGARSLGVPEARAATLRAFAAAVRGEAGLLAGLDPLERSLERLTAIRGVGAWTASYVALRGLGHADAFPAGDLGLRKAFGRGRPVSERALRAASERWRPWRGYAALHLWASLGDGVNAEEVPS
jgi:AraC family transcriptional regulator of adaptative response / DNA-3-methyladenine glycosylase II